jgi:glycosyltransferase involved in cell wall biosynthesis
MTRDHQVTAVVLTLNEEPHLPDCLASLSWADSCVVLDSGSSDGTQARAREAGAEVVVHAFENYSMQRQRALSLVRTPWLLFVDADERVPPALAAEVRRELLAPLADGYWIPRENHFWGHAMRGGGWWPDHQLRLLSVSRASYDPTRAVHEVAHVEGETAKLAEPLVHINYDSLAEFRSKQFEYAALEVVKRRARGETVRPHNLVVQPVREFWRRYVTLGGWRDGGTGLTVCALMGWYELTTLRALR